MANDMMALQTLLASNPDDDFLREMLGFTLERLMELEVEAKTGADHGERNPNGRLTRRNGYRERTFETRLGTVELHIPKLRKGSYFPSRKSLSEPRALRWRHGFVVRTWGRPSVIGWSLAFRLRPRARQAIICAFR